MYYTDFLQHLVYGTVQYLVPYGIGVRKTTAKLRSIDTVVASGSSCFVKVAQDRCFSLQGIKPKHRDVRDVPDRYLFDNPNKLFVVDDPIIVDDLAGWPKVYSASSRPNPDKIMDA